METKEDEEAVEIVFVRSIYNFPRERISYETPFSEFFQYIGLPNDWEELFEKHMQELNDISNFLQSQKGKIIYPSFNEVFRIYYDIPPEKVSVIILGQDPYHTDGSACGYAFSIKDGKKLNPSLINIKTELKNEGFNIQKDSGNLTGWVEQGVFLLNTALTVERGKPNSHKDVWESFTRATIKYMTRVKKNLPIILWGKQAQDYYSSVSCKDSHHVIQCAHPSPFSAYRGFFNSNCFNRANEFLAKVGDGHVNFSVP
jgi:uracil-DNA glycosylase